MTSLCVVLADGTLLVAKHIKSIFSKLGLGDEDTTRRITAVLLCLSQ